MPLSGADVRVALFGMASWAKEWTGIGRDGGSGQAAYLTLCDTTYADSRIDAMRFPGKLYQVGDNSSHQKE